MKNLKKVLITNIAFAIIIAILSMLNFGVIAASNNINTKIEESKTKHPELVTGYGLKLDTSPEIYFKKKSNGKIEATVKDGTGIKTIKEKDKNTQKEKTKKVKNKGTKYKLEFSAPKKGKSKTMKYTVTDIAGKTGVANIVVRNENGKNKFDISTRLGFSYNNKTLNIILEDYNGINKNNASIEVIDNNNNKSLGKEYLKNVRIKDAVKYNEKIIYGIYPININKITKDRNGYYNIQVNTIDSSNISGMRIAKFTLKEKISNATKNTIKKHEKAALVVSTAKTEINTIRETKQEQRESKIHFLDTQYKYILEKYGTRGSDAIILESNGKYAMIDTGTPLTVDNIKKYLKELNIKELEFLLITHDHDDHRGGYIAGLGKSVKIKKLYIKRDVEYRKKTKDVIKIAKKEGTQIKDVAKRGNQNIKLGDFNIELYNTKDIIGKKTSRKNIDENANSILALVKIYGKKVFLSGDIEYASRTYGTKVEAIEKIVKDIGKVDVYKVAHHGNSFNNPESILKNLQAKYAIITDYKNQNQNKRTNELLERYGAKGRIYYTANGTTILSINNKGEISFQQLDNKYGGRQAENWRTQDWYKNL